jgi:radical SAM protein with 4Fe4S-binding SPASM domain
MKIRRHSKSYNFIGDTVTGITFRWGTTLNENPVFAPWPELADISISNHCTKGCEFCYRDSKNDNSFMSLEDYIYILEELNHPEWGNVFQVAIGGGEPLEHPQLKEIIEATISYNVVPNLTTNGHHLTEEIVAFLEQRIGAIALSINDIKQLKMHNLDLLRRRNIRTNIHYLLKNDNIGQAIEILNGAFNHCLSGINSIIFLTYKPLGRASNSNCLVLNDALKTFVKLIDKQNVATRIGFDACFVPLLLHFTNTNVDFIDSCECGFFSIYIDENLNVKPCSFATDDKYTFNLRTISFKDIWEIKYSGYRNSIINQCRRRCKNKDHCRGRCPYYDEINYCYSNVQEEILYVEDKLASA